MKRNSIISLIITLVALFVSLGLMFESTACVNLLFFQFHKPERKFDSRIWKSNRNMRISMLEDIEKTKLKGLTKRKLIDIYGNPDYFFQEDDGRERCYYNMNDGCTCYYSVTLAVFMRDKTVYENHLFKEKK